MKTTLKLMALVLAIAVVGALCLTACDFEQADFTVGILQPVVHPALGAANQGFQDELTRLMAEAGKTVKFEDKNANDTPSAQVSIVNTFIANRVDLMLTIGTGATQTAAGLDKNTPILFTAVTDPVGAGFVSSNGTSNNVTGTSDLNPVEQQMKLCKKLGMTKVAFLYTKSEQNSIVQINMAKQVCDEIGLAYVDRAVVDKNGIKTMMTQIAADESIDGIYIPTDNTLASNVATIHAQNKENRNLPIVCGEEGMNNLCGVATYSINYYELGKQTATMAFKILMGEKKVSEMPFEYQEGKPALSINQAIADEIGFDFDFSTLED